MSTVINDRMPQFKRSLDSVLDDAFREASRDLLIKAKTNAPYLKGQLRADTEVKSVKRHHWRVSFFKEYARFQEFGGDSKRRVRNYSTSGTGKGFLKKAGDEQSKKLTMTIKKHTRRARA